MTELTPTPEQTAIIDFAKSSSDNLLISALAGAAKTSTLILIAQALPKVSTLSLAFNKRIATEMTERLPGNCNAMTLNSLGHRVWADRLGKRLRLETSKNYRILTALIDELKTKKEKEEAYETFAETLKAVEQGKTYGFVPDGHFTNAKPLLGNEAFFASLEEEPSELQWQLILAATVRSISLGLDGEIDFSDQILLPTIFSTVFPKYPLVLVDEAQDLSILNHAMLKKLARKRLIAVGDACQSIYAFRGAHIDSMSVLKNTFAMTELTLSISFRCPRSIVREANWRAPHMRFPDWAIEGSVNELAEWSADTLPNAATILCRNNAPLFSLALRLLRDGRYPEIVGNDIAKSLVKTLKKFGPNELSQAEVFLAITKWEFAKAKKSRNKDRVADTAECLRIFARHGSDLGEAIAYAEGIMSAKGPIKLSTIHKAKGLEFETVYILDRHLIKTDEIQEQNLLYVAQTRSKSTLTYVESADYFVREENTELAPEAKT